MKVTLTFHECNMEEAGRLISVARTTPVADLSSTASADLAPVEADRATGAAPIITPAPTPKAPAPRPSRAKAAPDPAPAPAPPVAPVIPTPPVAQFTAAEVKESAAPVSFPDLMKILGPRMAPGGDITPARINETMEKLGLRGIGNLASRPDLIPQALELLA